MKDSEALYGAANYIHRHGWIKFALVDRHGAVCASGALLRVLKPNRDDNLSVGTRAQWARLQNVMMKFLGVAPSPLGGAGLAEWNDAKDRTAAEVYRAFLDCADEQRALGL